ncbi:MAG: hypothetical protein IT370_20330 [Deltaproteobacteria bacterium]|nr:hypothetical protein [Deltaproteobacteria bacterium]
MMRASRWWVVLAALATVGLGACAALLSSSKAPRTGDRILFSHKVHAENDLECVTCHEDVIDSKTLVGMALPKEEKCLECHEEDKTAGKCDKCHALPKTPGSYPPREPRVEISHQAHVPRAKEECSKCHARLPEPRVAAARPTMGTCRGCHEHEQDFSQGACVRCHSDLSRYPLKPVSAFSHQGNYVRQHGPAARSSADSCTKCHEQTFCADCHARTAPVPIELRFPEKVLRDFIHRADYRTRHTLEARAEPALCNRCHGQSFCTSCHTAQNLTPTALTPRSPHPQGYSFPGANSHARDARRDIVNCAACHDQGARSICIDCHKVGGVGGNPHTPSWLSRHDHDEIRRNGMCGYCH